MHDHPKDREELLEDGFSWAKDWWGFLDRHGYYGGHLAAKGLRDFELHGLTQSVAFEYPARAIEYREGMGRRQRAYHTTSARIRRRQRRRLQ